MSLSNEFFSDEWIEMKMNSCHRTKHLKILSWLFLILGVSLLATNSLSLFNSLRNPEIYQLKNGKDVTISYRDALKQIDREPGESETDYVYRLTYVVNQTMAHYWDDQGIDTYHMRIPIWNNYILWASSYLYPGVFLRYEFTDYKRALERGIGLCSQHAIIVESIFQKNGFEASIIGLNGHVVTSVEADGKVFISDADYGVVVPVGIEEIEQNPDIIQKYYQGFPNVDSVQAIYASKADNLHFQSVQDYLKLHALFEKLAYIAIWLIPAVLIIASGLLFISH